MPSAYKRQVIELLTSIQTGDEKPPPYINPNRYIQHNLAVGDGLEGFVARMKARPKGPAKANIVRVFEDGAFVFTHPESTFAIGPRGGFDGFRFEDGKMVEHWDNLQDTPAELNPSGHMMTDGPTTAAHLDKTEANKALMQIYMDDLLQGRR